MLCPACGSVMKKGERRCNKCGTLLIHGPKVRNESSFNTPLFNTLKKDKENAKKAAEEAAKRAAEAAAAKKAAEEAAKRAAEKAAAKKAAEEAAKKAAEEAAAKKAAEEAAKKAAAKKAAEEAAKKAAEEAEKKAAARKAAEEAAKKAAEEAEKKAAARKAAEEAAKKAAEEAAAVEAAIEEAIKAAQETAAKKAAAEKAAEEAAAKKAAEDAAVKKDAEKAEPASLPQGLSYKIIGGNFTSLSIKLDENQSIFTQSDAMVWMTPDIDIEENKKRGGLPFTAAYTSRSNGQEICFASRFPGGIQVINIGGSAVIVQKGAFLAAQPSVKLSAHVSMNMGDESGASVSFQKLSGAGLVFVAIGGGVIERELGPEETIKADTANIAAFEESVSFQTQMISDFQNTIFGEGLFLSTLTGPGKVWLQTLPGHV
jgi:uncharacterized protein (AIM24 family)